MVIYLFCAALLMIGLYSIIAKRNLVKIVVGVIIMEYAVNLFLITIGYKEGGTAPILTEGQLMGNFVDPLPQALVVTSIVIGLGVTALMIAICLRLYEKYGTLDESEIKRLKG